MFDYFMNEPGIYVKYNQTDFLYVQFLSHQEHSNVSGSFLFILRSINFIPQVENLRNCVLFLTKDSNHSTVTKLKNYKSTLINHEVEKIMQRYPLQLFVLEEKHHSNWRVLFAPNGTEQKERILRRPLIVSLRSRELIKIITVFHSTESR